MSNFLTIQEERRIKQGNIPEIEIFLEALSLRVMCRVNNDTWCPDPGQQMWWYPAAEYLSDAAMLYRLKEDEKLGSWLHKKTLILARQPVEEWVGPAFRNHHKPYCGHLETAHICWGLSSVLDLCPSLFNSHEQEFIRNAVEEKGIVLCEEWLRRNRHLGNWRGIMISGALVPAIILGNESKIDCLVSEMNYMRHAFQPDGSYGESLQYGNYLANAMMLCYEALIRYDALRAETIGISCYTRSMKWMAQSFMYQKPLSGWGEEPRARSVNFNDSAALFRPSGDLLLHVAVRCKKHDQENAGLARWMFDKLYVNCPHQGPHDLASFGMYNDWGFLTLPLLTHSSLARSPKEAGLPLTSAFSNGNVLIRDEWEGRSVVAIQAGCNEDLYAPGHLHGDLNSFIIAFNNERLLADPGHSCYRNAIHGLESASQSHNTCTFLLAQEELGLQEDLSKERFVEQINRLPRRIMSKEGAGPPIDRLGRQIHCQRLGDTSLVASEAGRAYGAPLKQFTRYWIQIGAHITIVWDRILAEKPVKTIWNWVLNKRDHHARVQVAPSEIRLYRQRAGLRLIHAGTAELQGPVYGFLHDAYHPLPARLGEGHSGSSEIYRFADISYSRSLQRMHVIVADNISDVDDWQLAEQETGFIIGKKEQACLIKHSGYMGSDGFVMEIKHKNRNIKINALKEKIMMSYE